MTLIQSKPSSVVAGTNNVLTMDKAQLISLITNSGDANAAYYADEANWKRVVFYYQDYTKKQKTVVMFDTSTNQGKFKTSSKSKYNKWQLRRIIIEDKDNGLFTLSRSVSSATSALNAQEMDVISPNRAPTGIMLTGATNNTKSISENTTFVGNLVAVDEDINDSHVFSIVNSGDAADFQIVGNNALHFKVAPNFESGKTSYTVTIKVTDVEGLFVNQTFTVTVVDIAEAPPAESFVVSATEVQELNAVGQTISVLSAVDPDGTSTFTFALVSGQGDSDNSFFYIDGNKLKAKDSFTYGVKDSYSARIRVTDAAGTSTEKVFSFSVIENFLTAGRIALSADGYFRSAMSETGTSGMTVDVFCAPSRRITSDGLFLSSGTKIYQKHSEIISGSSKLCSLEVISSTSHSNHVLSPDGNFLLIQGSSNNSNSTVFLIKRKGSFLTHVYAMGSSAPGSALLSISTYSTVKGNILFNFSQDSEYFCVANATKIFVYKKTDHGEYKDSIWNLHQEFTYRTDGTSDVPTAIEILSDKTLIMGFPNKSSGATANAGLVNCFYWDAATGLYNTNKIEILNPTVQSGSLFGKRICEIDNNTIIITAPGTSAFGRVYVFKKNVVSNTWASVQTITNSSSTDSFGCEISNYRNNRIVISDSTSNVKVFKNFNTSTNPFALEASLASSVSSNSQVVITNDSILCDPQKNYPLNDSGIVTSSNAGTNLFTKASNSTWLDGTYAVMGSDNTFYRYGGYSFFWNKKTNIIEYTNNFRSSLGTGSIQSILTSTVNFFSTPTKKHLFCAYTVGSSYKYTVFKNTETNSDIEPYWQEEYTLTLPSANQVTLKNFQINDEGTVFSVTKQSTSTSVGDVLEIYEKTNGVWSLAKTFAYSDFIASVDSSARYITQAAMNKTGNMVAFTLGYYSTARLKVFKKINNLWTEFSTASAQSSLSSYSTLDSANLKSGVQLANFDADDQLIFNVNYSSNSTEKVYSGFHIYNFNASNQMTFVQHIQPVTGTMVTDGYFHSVQINKDRNKIFCLRYTYSNGYTSPTMSSYIKKNGLWMEMIKLSKTRSNPFYFVPSVVIDSSGSNVSLMFAKSNWNDAANPRYLSIIEISNKVENEYFTGSSGVWVQNYLGRSYGNDSVVVNPTTRPALSTDATTMAVGITAADTTGVVKVYIKGADNKWVFQQTLTGSAGSEPISKFGYSVSLSSDGNTLAVGAPQSANSQGLVFIFKRTGNVWTQTTYLSQKQTGFYPAFGTVVSLNGAGTRLAVNAAAGGAFGTNVSSVKNGAVYIYNLDNSNNTWQFFTSFTERTSTLNGSLAEEFGSNMQLSASGQTLFVLNHKYLGSGGYGYLKIYKIDGGTSATFYAGNQTYDTWYDCTFQSTFYAASDTKVWLPAKNPTANHVKFIVWNNSSLSNWSRNTTEDFELKTPLLTDKLRGDLDREILNGNSPDASFYISQAQNFARNGTDFYKKINNTWTLTDIVITKDYSSATGWFVHSQDENTVGMIAGEYFLSFDKP